jgi:hypothetical protein
MLIMSYLENIFKICKTENPCVPGSIPGGTTEAESLKPLYNKGVSLFLVIFLPA